MACGYVFLQANDSLRTHPQKKKSIITGFSPECIGHNVDIIFLKTTTPLHDPGYRTKERRHIQG